MRTHVFTGNKEQIADRVASLTGDVREAIVFVEDGPDEGAAAVPGDDLFQEMAPLAVTVGGADYNRDAIYDAPDAPA